MQDALRRFKADIFQALAHPTADRHPRVTRRRELSAGALIEKLGIEQAETSPSTSQCCAPNRLWSNRKAGNQVFYSVRDPIITKVLSLMRTYFHAHLKEALADARRDGQAAPEDSMNTSPAWLPRSVECLR